MTKQAQRFKWILKQLYRIYPDAHCALYYESPFELLVATILSAQCTDERVNQVTSSLFKTYPDVMAFAQSNLTDLEKAVHPTGFFRNKARSIRNSARILLKKYEGKVPCNMDDLVSLPGVGRKTASVVMGNAFGKAEGIVVDTHVSRLSQRLQFSQEKTPEKIEQDLMKWLPAQDWVMFPHLMISHGRAVCKARKPLCSQCQLKSRCPSSEV